MKSGLQKALDHLRHRLNPNAETDAQLLNSFIGERDEAAFVTLVRRHGPMVLGVCRRILRNAHDTDDAFQATFLVLVQKARTLANRQALASWLYTVAFRTALEARARKCRREHKEKQMEPMPHREAAPAEAGDWQPLLDEELSRLPEKYRTPVILCELEGRARREVARQLGLAEGTLSSRLATARRMLAARLARRGITLSGGALAVAMSEVSACVPPSLVASTTKAALLIAAGGIGGLMTPAAILSKGVLKAMFIAKLKTTAVILLATVMLGTGGIVYCSGQGAAGGQARSSQDGPSNPLDAVRKENELLKINLRVTLEKIQALETEIKGLKGKLQAAAGPGQLGQNAGQVGGLGQVGGMFGLQGGQFGQLGQIGGHAGQIGGQIGQIGGQIGQPGQIGGFGAIGGPQGALGGVGSINPPAQVQPQRPDSATPIERALKAFLRARDENARKAAIDQMEKEINNLKEKGKRPAPE